MTGGLPTHVSHCSYLSLKGDLIHLPRLKAYCVPCWHDEWSSYDVIVCVCPDHMGNPQWHLETAFKQLWVKGGTAPNSVVTPVSVQARFAY